MAQTSTEVHERFRSVAEAIDALTTKLALLNKFEKAELRAIFGNDLRSVRRQGELRQLRDSSVRIETFLSDILEHRIEPIQITLGRSDSIAKYFAFIFVNRPRCPFDTLSSEFFGSGVYAIYYIGDGEAAYAPLSRTETPIYIGKADPDTPYAETTREQGRSLWLRLREHVKSISKTDLNPQHFEYRYASIQSGMQAAVEEYLIRLFRPIWNKEDGICFGIGKHGDSHKTRQNRRSPWDTMHPGRRWAEGTESDQVDRAQLVIRIQAHLAAHPPYKTLDLLREALVNR